RTASDNLDDLHVACGLDYLAEPYKSQLKARLGQADGTVLRSSAPVCGTSMQDVANSAQGNWFSSGAGYPADSEDAQLALIHQNVDPSTGAFSVGNAISSLTAGVYTFSPVGSGLVNRDFKLVKADGNVYCYDSFSSGNGAGKIVLIKLVDSTTLRIEGQSAANCGAGPWAFSASYTEFTR
ncbi:MAG: hypothetical protein AABZ44_02190, partial [Elusimicrobiota bacterium]